MSQRPGDMSSQYLSGQLGWNPRQQNFPHLLQTQGPESLGQRHGQRAVHFNAQRDAQMGMQDRMPKVNYGPSPFGQSIRQENPYRPSPPRRGPGGLGGGGFGGGSQGIDQFMDFMQQMMQMFKQFNSQGGGGYGQRRGPGGFPQPPQRYGQYQPQPTPQPSRILNRTQGPESLMPQFGWGGPSGREQSLGLMQTAGPESFQPLMQTQGHF